MTRYVHKGLIEQIMDVMSLMPPWLSVLLAWVSWWWLGGQIDESLSGSIARLARVVIPTIFLFAAAMSLLRRRPRKPLLDDLDPPDR